MDLSVVIPAYNEEGRIGATLAGLLDHLPSISTSFEVIVVDDGSSDGTTRVVEELNRPCIRLFRLTANQGKGAALRRGVLESLGSWVFFVDADLPYKLDFFDRALACLRAGRAGAAIGARDCPESTRDSSYPALRVWSGSFFSHLLARLLPIRIHDTQCGFKGFDGALLRRAIRFTEARGYTLDIEILLLLRLWDVPIERLPVRLERHHGSKVRLLRDSPRMVADVLRIRRRLRAGHYPSSEASTASD